jgi:hypothetical protein
MWYHGTASSRDAWLGRYSPVAAMFDKPVDIRRLPTVRDSSLDHDPWSRMRNTDIGGPAHVAKLAAVVRQNKSRNRW